MKTPFSGKILLIGCGYVGRCTLPLLLRHLDLPADRITVLDFVDARDAVADSLARGVRYVIDRITPDNMAEVLHRHVRAGDLIIAVGDQPIGSPDDALAHVAAARKAGRKNVLIRVEREGNFRFITMPVETD